MAFQTPVAKRVQSMLDDSYYTSDSPMLERRPWHPVFVYGSLREGFSRHELLEHCPKVGTGFTRGRNYKMFRLESSLSRVTNFPVVLNTLNEEEQGSIYGEVYLVSPRTMRNLDYIESNGIQYSRYSRIIDINSKTNPTVMCCWMYIGEPVAWRKTIESGTLVPVPRSTHPKTNSKYYVFKKSDSQSGTLRNM